MFLAPMRNQRRTIAFRLCVDAQGSALQWDMAGAVGRNTTHCRPRTTFRLKQKPRFTDRIATQYCAMWRVTLAFNASGPRMRRKGERMKTKVTFERTKTGPVAKFEDGSEVNPDWVTGTEMLANLGIKEGTTATVIVDEPEAYEWEWRRDGTRDGLVCTSNGFFYAHRDIRSTQEDYDRTESGLKTSGLWRPGDRIRPRPKKPTLKEWLSERGIRLDNGIVKSSESGMRISDVSGCLSAITEYFEKYPDAEPELRKEWGK